MEVTTTIKRYARLVVAYTPENVPFWTPIFAKAKHVKVFYRFRSVSDFKMLYLKDDGNSNDEAAGDEIFGGLIASNGNETIEYYVMAENPLSVGYEPANYMFELRKASLKELNN